MYTGDLRQTEMGTRYVDVVATDDDDEEPQLTKSLKTPTSRRQIPLHPELIALGFLQFVQDQREASSNPRLFRHLAYEKKYGDPAHYALRDFRDNFLPTASS